MQMTMKLAAIFSDNMVLQHDIEIPVWGWSTPGDKITVEFSGQKKNTVAKKDGTWSLKLGKSPVSCEPREIRVSSKIENHQLAIANVLVGEVWVCSGQSNMEWQLMNSRNAAQETANANYPNMRLFTVPKIADINPKQDICSSWNCCSPDTVAGFSAVAYFFGLEIHRKTGIPVGLINTSWGGTVAEAWTSREAMASDPFFKKAIREYEDELSNPGNTVNKALAKQKEWADKYDNKDTKNMGEEKGWHKPVADVADWKEMNLPATWQSTGHNHSGIFWFRREVDVPATWSGKDLTLSIGPTDKSDVTYFNGVRVGGISMEQRSDAWCTPRIYTIPGRTVKTGRNIISVRVFSNMHAGGFIGTPNQMRLIPVAGNNETPIQLSGIWKYKIEANFGLIPAPPPPLRGQGNPNSPYILFNNMIKPILPYGIRGAIWYQGESNADKAKQYRRLFPLMIKSWRNAWKQQELPFYFVQLANFNPIKKQPYENAWAELREAQAMTLSLPDTGMAVTIDIGEANDIHPRNKQDVGLRLALPALAKLHGFKNLVYSGPTYKSMKIEKNKIRISFDHLGGGLVVHGRELEGFSIAGKDPSSPKGSSVASKKFVWADAIIEGSTVVVSSPLVPKPVAVRYAWSENPACNLFNSSDLPASPFRTDNWPGITK
jgi:sialate O-acetylesterase